MVANLGLAVSISVGGAVQPWLLLWLGNWKTLHFVLFSQTVFILLVPRSGFKTLPNFDFTISYVEFNNFNCRFLHESVRLLASQGEVDKCVEILTDIARINEKKLDENFFPIVKA